MRTLITHQIFYPGLIYLLLLKVGILFGLIGILLLFARHVNKDNKLYHYLEIDFW